jgi:predicted DNA binding protein
MYYACIDVFHTHGLCNDISNLNFVEECFIDRADVFADNCVYIELSAKFDRKGDNQNEQILRCVDSTSESITMVNLLRIPSGVKIRYVMGSNTKSVIRITNRAGFILNFPLIIEKEREKISGVVYNDRSLQGFFDMLKKEHFKYKVKKIIKNEDIGSLNSIRWSWPISRDLGLTDMQKKIIHTAYVQGYYSFPRKANIKTIANIEGLSTSTIWEHLRKAEMKFMNLFLEIEGIC